MAQHDYNIANQGFPAFRTDLNNALSAVQTTNSGTSRPTGAVAGQLWLDTTSATSPTLKYYDGADDISLATIDHSANTVNWLDSTVSITGLSTTATGTVLTLSDTATTSTVNLIIDNDKEIRFREATANGTNYVSLSAPASLSADLTFTLPATDGTANQVLTTSGAGVLSFANAPTAFRNRVGNGDMTIDQRNAGASVTANDNVFSVDRWKIFATQSSKLTVQQNAGAVTPPAGFNYYLGYTSSSAYSITSSDYFVPNQGIEGYNVADLDFGTANAKSITLSFWVRSSLTGTFGGVIRNGSANRNYPFTYTISTSNTWEKKSITIAGDTSGTWNKTNGYGLGIQFGLGVGSTYSGTAGAWSSNTYYSATGATSLVGTNGATWYITGVQLEAGTSATDFEFLPIDVSLGRCQRYFTKITGNQNAFIGAGISNTSSTSYFYVKFPTTMRSAPTATQSTLTISDTANYGPAVSAIADFYAGTDSARIVVTHAAQATALRTALLIIDSTTTGFLALDSEL